MGTDLRAIQIIHQLRQLMSLGGSPNGLAIVVRCLRPSERAKEVKNLDLERSLLPMERELGVHWNTETDQCRLWIRSKQREIIRRGLISIVSSVHDPLGFVCPYML